MENLRTELRPGRRNKKTELPEPLETQLLIATIKKVRYQLPIFELSKLLGEVEFATKLITEKLKEGSINPTQHESYLNQLQHSASILRAEIDNQPETKRKRRVIPWAPDMLELIEQTMSLLKG